MRKEAIERLFTTEAAKYISVWFKDPIFHSLRPYFFQVFWIFWNDSCSFWYYITPNHSIFKGPCDESLFAFVLSCVCFLFQFLFVYWRNRKFVCLNNQNFLFKHSDYDLDKVWNDLDVLFILTPFLCIYRLVCLLCFPVNSLFHYY